MLNTEAQEVLIKWGLLSPPADGKWGLQSRAALEDFQLITGLNPSGEITPKTITNLKAEKIPEFVLTDDLASRLVRFMVKAGYFISRGPGRFNIIYLEGADQSGKPNSDKFNEWNDRRILLELHDWMTPKIVGNWLATTEPGATYTFNPMNPGGAFRIAFGQYRAWTFGRHGRTQYPALVQCGSVSGYRDRNKDGKRTGDKLVTGEGYGINQHHGWDMEFVNAASAGCLVGQSIEGHQDFMKKLRTDRRYLVNNSYIWHTTIIPADEL
jgi:hypothetical protein